MLMKHEFNFRSLPRSGQRQEGERTCPEPPCYKRAWATILAWMPTTLRSLASHSLRTRSGTRDKPENLCIWERAQQGTHQLGALRSSQGTSSQARHVKSSQVKHLKSRHLTPRHFTSRHTPSPNLTSRQAKSMGEFNYCLDPTLFAR